MAEEKTVEQVQGDVMIVATSILKPPKTRTALKFLPRTVEWGTVLIVGAFVALGLFIGSQIFDELAPIIYSGTVGGIIGFVAPMLSPLQGESLATWFGLQAKDMTAKRVNINGRKAKMYIGTYPLKRTALGITRILPSGGNVSASEHDERGYPQLNTTRTNPQLEQQRKLRASAQSKGLKASTSLSNQGLARKRGSRVKARNSHQSRTAPRVPMAKKTSVQDIAKGSKKAARKKGKRPSGRK